MSLVYPMLIRGQTIARLDFGGVLSGSCFLTKNHVELQPLRHSQRFERSHALSIDLNAKSILTGLQEGAAGYAQLATNGLGLDAMQIDGFNLEPELETLAAQGKSYPMGHTVPVSYASTQQVHIKSYDMPNYLRLRRSTSGDPELTRYSSWGIIGSVVMSYCTEIAARYGLTFDPGRMPVRGPA